MESFLKSCGVNDFLIKNVLSVVESKYHIESIETLRETIIHNPRILSLELNLPIHIERTILDKLNFVPLENLSTNDLLALLKSSSLDSEELTGPILQYRVTGDNITSCSFEDFVSVGVFKRTLSSLTLFSKVDNWKRYGVRKELLTSNDRCKSNGYQLSATIAKEINFIDPRQQHHQYHDAVPPPSSLYYENENSNNKNTNGKSVIYKQQHNLVTMQQRSVVGNSSKKLKNIPTPGYYPVTPPSQPLSLNAATATTTTNKTVTIVDDDSKTRVCRDNDDRDYYWSNNNNDSNNNIDKEYNNINTLPEVKKHKNSYPNNISNNDSDDSCNIGDSSTTSSEDDGKEEEVNLFDNKYNLRKRKSHTATLFEEYDAFADASNNNIEVPSTSKKLRNNSKIAATTTAGKTSKTAKSTDTVNNNSNNNSNNVKSNRDMKHINNKDDGVVNPVVSDMFKQREDHYMSENVRGNSSQRGYVGGRGKGKIIAASSSSNNIKVSKHETEDSDEEQNVKQHHCGGNKIMSKAEADLLVSQQNNKAKPYPKAFELTVMQNKTKLRTTNAATKGVVEQYEALRSFNNLFEGNSVDDAVAVLLHFDILSDIIHIISNGSQYQQEVLVLAMTMITNIVYYGSMEQVVHIVHRYNLIHHLKSYILPTISDKSKHQALWALGNLAMTRNMIQLMDVPEIMKLLTKCLTIKSDFLTVQKCAKTVSSFCQASPTTEIIDLSIPTMVYILLNYQDTNSRIAALSSLENIINHADFPIKAIKTMISYHDLIPLIMGCTKTNIINVQKRAIAVMALISDISIGDLTSLLDNEILPQLYNLQLNCTNGAVLTSVTSILCNLCYCDSKVTKKLFDMGIVTELFHMYRNTRYKDVQINTAHCIMNLFHLPSDEQFNSLLAFGAHLMLTNTLVNRDYESQLYNLLNAILKVISNCIRSGKKQYCQPFTHEACQKMFKWILNEDNCTNDEKKTVKIIMQLLPK